MEAKKRGLKKTPIIIVSLILILILGGVFAVTYNNTYKFKVDSSSDILGKLKEAELGDGTALISKNDMNSILCFLQNGEIVKGNLTIRQVSMDFDKTGIKIYAPIRFKGINLLLSAVLEVGYTEQNIRLVPKNFKIGLIPIPRNIIMDRLKAYSTDKYRIDVNAINIAKKAFPISIDAVIIKNGNMMVIIKKDPQMQQILVKIDEFKQKPLTTAPGNTMQKYSEKSQNRNNNSQNIRRIEMLRNTKVQLANARNSCKTEKEKILVDMATKVIDSMLKDPKYQYMSQANNLRSYYESLSSAEMENVKTAILNNVDTKALVQINSSN